MALVAVRVPLVLCLLAAVREVTLSGGMSSARFGTVTAAEPYGRQARLGLTTRSRRQARNEELRRPRGGRPGARSTRAVAFHFYLFNPIQLLNGHRFVYMRTVTIGYDSAYKRFHTEGASSAFARDYVSLRFYGLIVYK